MRYFESNNDFLDVEIKSLPEFIKFLTMSLILAPVRLLTEISRKLLFTGEKLYKIFFFSFIYSTISLVITLLVSILITNKIYFDGVMLPIYVLASCFILTAVLMLFTHKFSLPLTDKEIIAFKEEELEKENEEEMYKSYESLYNMSDDSEKVYGEESLTEIKDNLVTEISKSENIILDKADIADLEMFKDKIIKEESILSAECSVAITQKNILGDKLSILDNIRGLTENYSLDKVEPQCKVEDIQSLSNDDVYNESELSYLSNNNFSISEDLYDNEDEDEIKAINLDDFSLHFKGMGKI